MGGAKIGTRRPGQQFDMNEVVEQFSEHYLQCKLKLAAGGAVTGDRSSVAGVCSVALKQTRAGLNPLNPEESAPDRRGSGATGSAFPQYYDPKSLQVSVMKQGIEPSNPVGATSVVQKDPFEEVWGE